MKHKLLTSTAMGALLATSGYVYAEGVGLKFFGGINWLGKQSHEGFLGTDTLATVATFDRSGPAGTLRQGFYGDFDMDNETGYVFGGAVNYQWDNGLILELEAAYRRNKIDLGGSGFTTFGETTTLLVSHRSDSRTFTLPRHYTSHGSAQNTVSGSGHISAVSLMANAWYEFNLGNNEWNAF